MDQGAFGFRSEWAFLLLRIIYPKLPMHPNQTSRKTVVCRSGQVISGRGPLRGNFFCDGGDFGWTTGGSETRHLIRYGGAFRCWMIQVTSRVV
jgi:hypothetical protein